jgi:hypothetical protein
LCRNDDTATNRFACRAGFPAACAQVSFTVSCGEQKESCYDWEIVADKLSAAGWVWGYCSAVTRDGVRWVVDVHGEGRRYIVHSDELLSAFLELEAVLL